MTQSHRPRGFWGLIAAAVALVAPAIAAASPPPPEETKKAAPADPQPVPQQTRSTVSPLDKRGANLAWLHAVGEALSSQRKKEASEFEPPGKPPDRPPDKPGQHDPPNPPGKPPDRPPSNSNSGGNGNGPNK